MYAVNISLKTFGLDFNYDLSETLKEIQVADTNIVNVYANTYDEAVHLIKLYFINVLDQIENDNDYEMYFDAFSNTYESVMSAVEYNENDTFNMASDIYEMRFMCLIYPHEPELLTAEEIE